MTGESPASNSVAVFVLKSRIDSMRAVETHLKGRNFKVWSAINLRDALLIILQRRPQFVLVTADHSNKKVMMVPKLLQQSYPVHVISFAENAGLASARNLTDMGVPYSLSFPVNGQAVERIINNLLAESQKNPSKAVAANLDAGAFQAAQSALHALIGSNLNATPPQSSTPASPSAQQSTPASSSAATTAESSAASFTKTSESSAKVGVLGQSDAEEALGENSTSAPKIVDGSAPRLGLQPKYKPAPRFQNQTKSQFEKLTEMAINESIRPTVNQKHYFALDLTNKLSCITVEAGHHRGYLLAAAAGEHVIDQKLLESIKGKLFNYMTANGLSPKESSGPFPVTVQDVSFEDWAIEQADFLQKAIHAGTEVALAFFPTQDQLIQLQPSEHADMVQFELSKVEAEKPVDFDLYIYMQENNKYLLYVQNGRPLLANQKNRLVDKGIGKLHLMKTDAEKAKRFVTQNYFNDLIKKMQKRP